MVRVRSAVPRRRGRALALGLLLLCAPPSSVVGQDQPAGQAGNVWNLGRLDSGKRYPTSVTAVNINCKGKHDFQLEVDQGASFFLSILGDPVARRLAPGQSKTLPAVVDLTSVAPGEFDLGHLVTRCLDCPPTCKVDYQALSIRLTVVRPTGAAAPTTSETSPPTPGSNENDKEAGVCGPDVTRALSEALTRIRQRKARLPKGAVPDFSKADAPFRMIAEVVPLCPSPLVRHCADTVWLWGHCVAASVPEWVVEGFVSALFESDAIHKAPRPDSVGNDGFNFAHLIGASLSNPEVEDPGEKLERFIAKNPAPGSAFSLAKLCRRCGDAQSPFAADWSTRFWVLSDGSYVSFRE